MRRISLGCHASSFSRGACHSSSAETRPKFHVAVWSTVVTSIKDVNQQIVDHVASKPGPVFVCLGAQQVSCGCHPVQVLKGLRILKSNFVACRSTRGNSDKDFLSALCLPLAGTAGYALCHMSDKFCGRLTLDNLSYQIWIM